ncbi:tetratricopeptide repeat protein [Thiocystis minor]|uniref:tetratricopeptide repeat protein n=1 Tax=Thiocystis minor TaxID=61597 RepID=UPI001912F227|nr:tetratricopeptide repeat protein [Thiocystis minor]
MERVFGGLLLASMLVALLVGCGEADRKQAYFDRGMELLAHDNQPKARLEFKNVLQIDPKHAPAWYQLAKIEAAQENWNAAFGAYGKAVELDPQNVDARVSRAQLLFDSNQIDDALADVEIILTADPKHADALALRAAVRGRQGDLDAAETDAQSALAVDPQHLNALALLAEIGMARNDREAAGQFLERAIQAHPSEVRPRLMLAGVYQASGKPEAARAQLEQLIKLEPSELAHVARLAAFLTQEGQKDAAEAALRAAIETNPEQLQAKLLLAEWAAQQRGVDPGIQVLEDFIAVEPDVYDLRFALAELERAAGRGADAVTVYRTIIERASLGPQGMKARTQLAALLMADKRVDEASRLVEEVLKEDARDGDALLVRAAIAVGRKDADQAIADLQNVLQNKPNATSALLLLAQAHVLKEETTLAQDALEKAIDAAPTEPQAYLALAQLRVDSGDMQGASVTLERFLDRVPENDQVQSALARIQLSQQDWGAMERTATRILETRPEHPLGYYLKGLIFQRNDRLQESIEQFEKALEKRSDAVEPLLALTRSHMALGQADRAEQRLKQLLAEQPANAAALNLLGEVYASTRRYPDALEQFKQVIVLFPKSPNAYARLAELQGQSGDLKGALATLRSGVEATNRNAFLLFRLGIALQESGDDDAAIAAYEEVLKSNSEADAVINNLSMLLASRRTDPASLTRALELAQRFEGSDQWVLLDTLGWVQFRAGEVEKAVVTLEKAAGLIDPDPPEMQYHLGMVYAARGRRDEAKALLTSALDANSPFPGIEEARETLGGL